MTLKQQMPSACKTKIEETAEAFTKTAQAATDVKLRLAEIQRSTKGEGASEAQIISLNAAYYRWQAQSLTAQKEIIEYANACLE